MSNEVIDVKKLLEKHGACDNGIFTALSIFGEMLPPGMTVVDAIKQARENKNVIKQYISWCIGRLCTPQDFGIESNTKQQDTVLAYSILENCRFTNVDFDGALFYNSYAKNIVFETCYLANADFMMTDLQKATFLESDCTNACFVGADLRGVIFEETSTKDANFKNALRNQTDAPIPGWFVNIYGILQRILD